MKKHKAVLLILLTVLIINLFPIVVFPSAETDLDYIEQFDDTDVPGLDIAWAKETDDYGIIPVYNDNGDMYAIKTWVTPTRPIVINHKLASAVNDGMMYISFDYKTTEKINDSFLRLKSGNTQFQICGFRNTGKFGHFLEFSKWALDKNTSVEYSPDTWYKVGILFDLKSRIAYLYFGETETNVKLIETIDIPVGFGNITDVVLAHSFGDYTPAMWDNLKICQLTAEKIDFVQKSDKVEFENEIYKNYTNILLSEDFRAETIPDFGFSEWSQNDAVYGIQREQTEEGEFALKSWVGLKNPVVLTHSLNSPINGGVYFVSFDWLSKGGYNDCYLRIKGDESQYQICGFRNTGKFGKFIDFSKWALNKDTEMAYSADIWYTVSVVMDFDLKNVYIWFGEKGSTPVLLERDKMGDGFKDFHSIMFVHSYGEYPDVLWDNMTVCRLNSETARFVEDKANIQFDESVKAELALMLSSEHKGNIFSNSENVEIFADYNNRSLVHSEYDVFYELCFGDEVLLAECDKLTIGKNGELIQKLNLPTNNRYGFFSFRVYNEDKTEILAETRFYPHYKL